MSRPEWCPQDVWDAAELAEEETFAARSLGRKVSETESHARAILAERERCVAIANDERILPFYKDASKAHPSDVSYDMAIDHVVESIRGNL